ncbi:hypothetical protein JYU34_000088 [Plutella xylostella]|uniref:Uncharacterized protein n=1 Tax=Plutella xylostella TaxID=51655 RepID=A0ABQ7R6T9_PLUXY|nr:hypothetical protein JYU34_000088 [Plutella xylostella]
MGFFEGQRDIQHVGFASEATCCSTCEARSSCRSRWAWWSSAGTRSRYSPRTKTDTGLSK